MYVQTETKSNRRFKMFAKQLPTMAIQKLTHSQKCEVAATSFSSAAAASTSWPTEILERNSTCINPLHNETSFSPLEKLNSI